MNNNLSLKQPNRFLIVDLMRATAIILMVFFHFFFDLNYFQFVKLDFSNNTFWYLLPRIIVFLFFTCVGISLRNNHESQINWQKLQTKLAILALLALIISIVTFIIFPKKWVYFGTLHSIFCSILISLPFIKLPKISLIITILLFVLFYFYPKEIMSLSRPSVDHVSLYPWSGCVFLGIYLHSVQFHLKGQVLYTKKSLKTFLIFIQWLSKNSLKIYITHQVFLFLFVLALSKLLR
jgi:uncharacterized membrane protein